MFDDIRNSRIAAKLFNTPLFLLPDTAELIGQMLLSRSDGALIPQASRFVGEVATQNSEWGDGYRVEGRVAVISTVGELVNRGAYVNASSGVVSYEGIEELFDRAGKNDAVKYIVHDMQSPGGEAYQMSDVARSLPVLANEKPITTVINGMAASAGYGLACVGDEIVIGESAIAGSIGVVILHMDQSKWLEAHGLKSTFIHVGATKVLGNGFESLSKEARDHLQSKVETCMDRFGGLVADFRPSLSLEQIRDLEADTFMGQDAIDVGLADRIGTVRSVVEELNSAQGGRIFSSKKGIFMENKDGSPEAENTGITQAALDQAVATAKSEGFAEGTTATTQRFTAALNAEGVAGNAARMDAALDLLGKTAEMSGEDVAAFVTKSVAAEETSASDGQIDYDDARSNASDLAGNEPKGDEKSGLSAKIDRKIKK